MLLEWSSVFIGAVSELDQELMYHIPQHQTFQTRNSL
ncbi:predicted protein [Botrytis cinerea T4]|uniref:Uncharacterized protein n=1 Tax=Botryotinia fuckeliana (strain T4) TaxID=999810 RepID=G2YH89_BOTF4|nr:predicted protein [Botrytis cinerea T4]